MLVDEPGAGHAPARAEIDAAADAACYSPDADRVQQPSPSLPPAKPAIATAAPPEQGGDAAPGGLGAHVAKEGLVRTRLRIHVPPRLAWAFQSATHPAACAVDAHAAAPPASAPAQYVGIYKQTTRRGLAWRAQLEHKGKYFSAYGIATRDEAAHAYDGLVRQQGLVSERRLNFARPDECAAQEVAALKWRGRAAAHDECALGGAADAQPSADGGGGGGGTPLDVGAPPDEGMPPHARSAARPASRAGRFLGVSAMTSRGRVRWRARMTIPGRGDVGSRCVDDEEEAALAYDELVRRHGLVSCRLLNFARPDERAAQAAAAYVSRHIRRRAKRARADGERDERQAHAARGTPGGSARRAKPGPCAASPAGTTEHGSEGSERVTPAQLPAGRPDEPATAEPAGRPSKQAARWAEQSGHSSLAAQLAAVRHERDAALYRLAVECAAHERTQAELARTREQLWLSAGSQAANPSHAPPHARVLGKVAAHDSSDVPGSLGCATQPGPAPASAPSNSWSRDAMP